MLAVRQSGVFTAVVQPPLILFVAVPGAYFLFHGGTIDGIKDILINCGYPLIERFPLMFFTSGVVLLIGMVRWYQGMSSRRTAPADTAGRRDAPEGDGVRASTAKIAGALDARCRRGRRRRGRLRRDAAGSTRSTAPAKAARTTGSPATGDGLEPAADAPVKRRGRRYTLAARPALRRETEIIERRRAQRPRRAPPTAAARPTATDLRTPRERRRAAPDVARLRERAQATAAE